MKLNPDLVRHRCQEIAESVSRLEKIAEMARFRNLLVHVYWEVEERVVYDIIRTHLRDLRHYCQAVVNLI
jgi:uncharacterized protein YutE (UPF0331/DUF86 family)